MNFKYRINLSFKQLFIHKHALLLLLLWVIFLNILGQMTFASRPSSLNDNDICLNNRIDVIVILNNGKIYSIRHNLVWRMIIDRQAFVLKSESKPSLLSDIFPGLPSDISMGFTVQGPQYSSNKGQTLFLKLPKYYLYNNYEKISIRSPQHWNLLSFVDNQLQATLFNSSLVLISKRGLVPDSFRFTVGGEVFVFDTDQFPELTSFYSINKRIKNVFDWYRLKKLMPTTTPNMNENSSNETEYLAIFEHGYTDGLYYCLTKLIDGDCQNLLPINTAFECSSQVEEIKTDRLYLLWKWASVPLSITIADWSGTMFALLIVNLLMLINTWQLFNLITKHSLNLATICNWIRINLNPFNWRKRNRPIDPKLTTTATITKQPSATSSSSTTTTSICQK